MSELFDKNAMIAHMNKDTFAVKTTGMEIDDVRPGYARIRLRVEDRHLNAIGITQGGVLFTLADFALAVASNTVEGVESVGIEGSISFLRPSKTGDVLTAEATEIARTRSLSTVEVSLTDQAGTLLARFHGRAFLRKVARLPESPH
ncbi:MAG TPA: hypothetical protein DEB39_13785 [Planctomycetaceae bacterium]|nr:hypothetical protein [Planctomycetaceae bacterium]